MQHFKFVVSIFDVTNRLVNNFLVDPEKDFIFLPSILEMKHAAIANRRKMKNFLNIFFRVFTLTFLEQLNYC